MDIVIYHNPECGTSCNVLAGARPTTLLVARQSLSGAASRLPPTR